LVFVVLNVWFLTIIPELFIPDYHANLYQIKMNLHSRAFSSPIAEVKEGMNV